jgi:hypothetical protein
LTCQRPESENCQHQADKGCGSPLVIQRLPRFGLWLSSYLDASGRDRNLAKWLVDISSAWSIGGVTCFVSLLPTAESSRSATRGSTALLVRSNSTSRSSRWLPPPMALVTILGRSDRLQGDRFGIARGLGIGAAMADAARDQGLPGSHQRWSHLYQCWPG